MRPVLCVCILALPLLAQISGPFPGGGGRRGGTNGTGRGQPESRTTREKGKDLPIVTTTEGLLRRVTSNQIVIEPDDHRIVWYHTSDKMTYDEAGKELDPKALAVGDHVSVDSTANNEDVYTAVSLTRRSVGTAEDRYATSRDWDLPPLFTGQQTSGAQTSKRVTRDPGDDRPVLRREKAASPPPSTDDSPKVPEKAEATPAPQPNVQKAAAPPEEPEDTRPATTIRPPDPKLDADDSGPPVLKRGGPGQRRAGAQSAPQSDAPSSPAATPAVPATAASPAAISKEPGPRLGSEALPARDPSSIPIEDDPVIAKAREAAATYMDSLPNFFAKQLTTRYATENIKKGWDPQDVISADIAYEDGKESYKNIRIGNKPTNKSMDELPGTHSSGEFSTLLEQLMDPGARATFRRTGTGTVRGRAAFTYKFEVTRTESRWRIVSPSQLYFPAYGALSG